MNLTNEEKSLIIEAFEAAWDTIGRDRRMRRTIVVPMLNNGRIDTWRLCNNNARRRIERDERAEYSKLGNS